jgi:DNA-directed RNA polymerase specialized sigma24 family protein
MSFDDWYRGARPSLVAALTVLAANVVRRRARRAALERRFGVAREAVTPPEVAPEVWIAVRALPSRQREAIALRYLLDLSERGVADAMGVAEGTASATLATARAALAGALGEPSDDPVGAT